MILSIILFALFLGSYLIFLNKITILGKSVYYIQFFSDEAYEVPYELRNIWLIVIVILGTIAFINIIKYLKEN